MRPRPARLAARSLAALSLAAAVTAAVFWFHPRSPDLAELDEARLGQALERLGYHVHVEPADRPLGGNRVALAGFYVAREEPPSWEDVARLPRGDASSWRGCAVAVRRGGAPPGDPDYLAAGPWILSGDPAE